MAQGNAGYRAAALLHSGCGVLRLNEGWLVLGFRHELHAAKMRQGGLLGLFSDAAMEEFGGRWRVECVLDRAVEIMPYQGKYEEA